MTSFTDNFSASGAFADFFDEGIAVETKTGHRQTVRACVFSDETADPVAEQMDSDVETITVNVRPEDWRGTEQLRRGDTIVRPCAHGKRYKVAMVRVDLGGIVVTAREV